MQPGDIRRLFQMFCRFKPYSQYFTYLKYQSTSCTKNVTLTSICHTKCCLRYATSGASARVMAIRLALEIDPRCQYKNDTLFISSWPWLDWFMWGFDIIIIIIIVDHHHHRRSYVTWSVSDLFCMLLLHITHQLSHYMWHVQSYTIYRI